MFKRFTLNTLKCFKLFDLLSGVFLMMVIDSGRFRLQLPQSLSIIRYPRLTDRASFCGVYLYIPFKYLPNLYFFNRVNRLIKEP